MQIAQVFDQLMLKLDKAYSLTAKDKLVRQFAGQQSSPIIESQHAVFFYISREALTVALEGDWTGWQPTASMTYLPDTPLWYRVETFPDEARLEYRVVVNGHPRLDPRNSRISLSGFGSHSEFAMPNYHPPQEIVDHNRIARGTVEQHWMNSRVMDDRRIFWINFPPGYDSRKQYPVAYFNDGDDFLNYGDLPRIMDYLIEHRQVKPFIAVMTRPNNREWEYGLNDRYVRFISEELVPWVDACYPTIGRRSARALFGVAHGALCALHIARQCPHLFGLVAGQSCSFNFGNGVLLQDYATAKNLNIRFHFTVGQYEFTRQGVVNGQENHLNVHQRFVDILRQNGNMVAYATYPEGHQWGLWRSHVGEALRYFWGARS